MDRDPGRHVETRGDVCFAGQDAWREGGAATGSGLGWLEPREAPEGDRGRPERPRDDGRELCSEEAALEEEAPVLVEMTGVLAPGLSVSGGYAHQGVPAEDTVMDEDGDTAGDFIFADPPPNGRNTNRRAPPSSQASPLASTPTLDDHDARKDRNFGPPEVDMIDLTLADDAAMDEDPATDTTATGPRGPHGPLRCGACGRDVTADRVGDADSWRDRPPWGRWTGRCESGCEVSLCGACLVTRATDAMNRAAAQLTARLANQPGDANDDDGAGKAPARASLPFGAPPVMPCPGMTWTADTSGHEGLTGGCGAALRGAPVEQASNPAAYGAWADAATEALFFEGSGADGAPSAGSRSSFTRCPHPSCRVFVEKLPAAIGRAGLDRLVAERDPTTGRWMSREALEHRYTHRYRCGACAGDFCGACHRAPYHVGMSCENAASAAAAPRCRYCDERVLPSGGGSDDGSYSGGATVPELKRRAGVADTSWCVQKAELCAVAQLAASVCGAEACQARLADACTRVHPCGHPCGGIRGETACLPCLWCPATEGTGGGGGAGASGLPDADAFCPICYVEAIGKAPAIRLGCGHVVHRACAVAKIRAGWPGPSISFNHLQCPLCGVRSRPASERGSEQAAAMAHPSLREALEPALALRREVMHRGRRRLLARAGGAGSLPAELQPGGRYEGRPGEFALDTFNYYLCERCEAPYFGGDNRACGPGPGGVGNPPGREAGHALVCGACTAAASGAACAVHGREELQYKCRYCCDVAVWWCFGTTHFCDACHRSRPDAKPCAPPKRCDRTTCPLRIDHPPHGVEFCLGCALCRSAGDVD